MRHPSHPRERFQRYVLDRWGQSLETLDQGDRDIAMADWQTEELAARLNGRYLRTWRDHVVEKGGPWAVVAAMFAWALNGG